MRLKRKAKFVPSVKGRGTDLLVPSVVAPPSVVLGAVGRPSEGKTLTVPSLSPSLSSSLTNGGGQGSHANNTSNSCNSCNVTQQLRLGLHTRSLRALPSEHKQHAADSSNRCNNEKKELVALTTGKLAVVLHKHLRY